MDIIEICILAGILVCILDVLIAVFSLRQKSQYSYPLAACCLLSAVVMVSYIFSILSTDYFFASVCASIYFITIDLLLNALLVFTLLFTNHPLRKYAIWLRNISLPILFLDLISLSVNPFYEAAISYQWTDAVISHYTYVMYPLYHFHLAYCYVLCGIVLMMLLDKVIRMPLEYGKQYLLCTLSLTMIIGVNGIFLFIPDASAWSRIDFSIIGYSFVAIFFCWCCFIYPRQGMLDQLRYGIFESLDEGIVLFNLEHEMILRNSKASQLLPKQILSDSTLDQFANILGLSVQRCRSELSFTTQSYVTKEGSSLPLRIDYRKLLNARGRMLGSLFVLADVSKEIDRLTGFYNLDSFQLHAADYVEINGSPTVAAAFDINGLSVLNRTQGHESGDEWLRSLADLLREKFGKDSLYLRGQDAELVILCHDMDEQAAAAIARSVCSEFKLGLQYAISTPADGEIDPIAAIDRADNAMRIRKLVDPKTSHSALVTSLIRTMEEWDTSTREHVMRTQKMCMALGSAIHLSDVEMSTLSLFSVLHDIGKVGLPLEILHKPGWMTPEEVSILHSHVVKGAQIAESAPELRCISQLIRSHHEFFNGKGYPDGLSGQDIPYLSRLLSVVDAYDAMTHNRSYRKSKSPEEAEQELLRCAGSQFDPEIVDAFLALLTSQNFGTDYEAEAETTVSSQDRSVHHDAVPETLLHQLPFSRYVLDQDMKVIFADSQFEKLTGYTQEDIRQGRVSQQSLIPPEQHWYYFHTVETVLSNQPSALFEHNLVRKDGSLEYVFCMGRIYFDSAAMQQRSEIVIVDYRDTHAMKQAVSMTQSQVLSRMEQWQNTMRRDPLTGLLNHSAFISAANQDLEKKESRLLLIMMDIDDFKLLNDSFGHPVGDEILVFVSQTMQRLLDDTDYAGRLGGDEFAISLHFPQGTPDQVMHDRGKQLFHLLSIAMASAKHPCTLSAGAAIMQQTTLFNELYEQADTALYDSKRCGKNCYWEASDSHRERK